MQQENNTKILESVESAPNDPIALFREWLAEAEESEINNPEAMTLATAGKDGMPSARAVLLKEVDERGFVFYTNSHSRKGRHLQDNPKAALLFYWKSLQRQVRIEGPVEQVSDAEADTYFFSRPRGSQIGAWASQQSERLESRQALEEAIAALDKKYDGEDVPRPPHWTGYRVIPQHMEFWAEREFRLHDRITYELDDVVWTNDRMMYDEKDEQGWVKRKLYP